MRLVVFVVALLMCASTSAAQGPSPEERDQRMRQVERAFRRGDLARLDELAQELDARLQSAGGFDPAARYDFAFAAWRQQLLLSDAPKRHAERHALLERARNEIEAVLHARPNDVEAAVLLSSIAAFQADTTFLGGLRHGRLAHRVATETAKRAPRNPRALLQLGIMLMFVPRPLGGGPDASIVWLQRARVAFEAQASTSPWPDWGATDAAGWLGRALAATGRRDEARAVYDSAVAAWPDARWITEELLPALDSKEP